MPVGTQATVKARDAGRCRAHRRRHPARQHLSSDAAAGRGARRGARRPAQLHELAQADPDRFRRLPGHVAVAAAQARRARRDLPLASRRRDVRTLARARDRDPAAARRRHLDAARRMPPAAGDARRDRARDAAVAALGGALQARVRGRAAGPRAVRHRAGRRRSGACGSKARARWSAWISTATRSAGLRSASRRR